MDCLGAQQIYVVSPLDGKSYNIDIDSIDLHSGSPIDVPAALALIHGVDVAEALCASGLKLSVQTFPDTIFITPTFLSPLLGGKGGFGALLKAVGKRAGKKKTTDFGACRDLNGRRLRHVNDEIKLERWRREQERKKNKEPAPSVESTITDSGIDNWHLGVPTWSEGVSNKQKYRNKKRKFNERRKEEAEVDRLEREKTERRMEEQRKATEYAMQEAEVGLGSNELKAMMKVEKVRKRIKDGKLKKLFSEVEGSSVIWGKGGLVTGKGGDGKDDCLFSTVYLTPPSSTVTSGRYYYEVVCVTVDKDDVDIPLQVGYLTPTSLPMPSNQDGVGDVEGSVGFDGGRGLLFVDGLEKEEDGTMMEDDEEGEEEGRIEWVKDDVLGVIYDAGERSIQFTLNGSVLPKVKAEGVGGNMVMGISVNPGGEVRVRIGDDEMEYLPEGCMPVGDLLMMAGGEQGGKKRKLDDGEGDVGDVETEVTMSKPTPAVAAAPPAAAAATTTTTTTTATAATTPPRFALTLEEIIQSYTEESLSALPLDTLKITLQALGLKAGGSAAERARRLWVVKDLKRSEIPGKMRDKKVFDAVTKIIENKGKW